ncbi:MAG: hypothetical protein ACYCSF_12820 [Acidimicrobiales bacterium]
MPTSAFPPLAVGFMGLGTGYLIYGPQELFGYPKRSATVDFGTGMWGIWLPGFMQFVTGIYLWKCTSRSEPRASTTSTSP